MGGSDLGGGGGVEFWRAEAQRLAADNVALRARVEELEGQVDALAEKVSVLARMAFGTSSDRLSLGAQRVGRLARFVEQPLAFGLGFVVRLGEQRVALLVELLVLVLELVALLLAAALLRVGVRELAAMRFSRSSMASRTGL